jgi:glycosyltransferase involved in cell wall biosynthesis
MKKIALIVCTKDRPFDLDRLLKSVMRQTRLPDHLIIVDGSDDPIKHVVDKFDQLSLDYVTVRPPSLPKQRNVGISRIPDDIDWVGFLDDDLELDEDSIEMIEKSIEDYKGQKELAGLSMIINNIDNVPYSGLRSLFLLDHKNAGRMTLAGAPTYLRQTNENVEVDWLSGGTTFWSHKVLKEYSYDEWFDGVGYFEDVDFSYRVSRKYGLLLCGPSKCAHFQHPVSKSKNVPLGVWQITSWWYFIKKTNDFNPIFTMWGMFYIFVNNVAFGIIKPNSHRFLKALGNLKGFWLILSGQALDRRTFQK